MIPFIFIIADSGIYRNYFTLPYLTAIKLDEENKLLFAYDIKDNIIDEQSEGILNEVNELMYQKIASHFHIKPEDFGVQMV